MSAWMDFANLGAGALIAATTALMTQIVLRRLDERRDRRKRFHQTLEQIIELAVQVVQIHDVQPMHIERMVLEYMQSDGKSEWGGMLPQPGAKSQQTTMLRTKCTAFAPVLLQDLDKLLLIARQHEQVARDAAVSISGRKTSIHEAWSTFSEQIDKSRSSLFYALDTFASSTRDALTKTAW